LSTEEEAFNPPRITVIRDIAKLLKGAKNLEEAIAKLKNYVLAMFGLDQL
jgi:hypothetical protein